MRWVSWINNSFLSRATRKAKPPAQRRVRPSLEVLEGRLCPSTVGYWRFEEGIAGSNATLVQDSSGNNLYGTAYAGPSYPIYQSSSATHAPNPIPLTGQPNNLSLQFNDAIATPSFQGRITIADNPLLALTHSLTVEAYINPANNTQTGEDIVGRGYQGGVAGGQYLESQESYDLYVAGPNVFFSITNPSGVVTTVTAPLPGTNQWAHVGGTLNDTTGVQAIYVNGILGNSIVTSNRPNTISSYYSPGVDIGNGFNGLIDEVRLSDQALTPSQFLDAPTSAQAPPTVTNNPASMMATVGANVAFIAAANGNPTPTVQWQVSTDGGKTFTNISGATSTVLGLYNVTSAMNGNEYQAVFTNSIGSVTSTAATLSVQYAPTITLNPSNQIGVAGQNVTFTAAANGNPTPTVQWQVSTDSGKTFTNISGATSTALALNNVTSAMNDNEYQAVFTNSAGSVTTSAATLGVQFAPTITLNPSNQTATAVQNVTFTAAATGNPTPTVQWQVSTDNGTTFNNISGATSTSLTLNAVTAAMNGNEYEAVFANSAGSVTTSAAVLAVQYAPRITLRPTDETATAGQSVTFTATATGNPNPTVQWQVSADNGATFSNVSGATSTSLTLNAVTAAMNDYIYQAVFTNTVGSVTTNVAALNVQSLPSLQADPTVAYYRFEEGSPGTLATNAVVDSSSNHLNGIAVNGPVYSSSVPTNTIPQTGLANNVSMQFENANPWIGHAQGISIPDYPAFALSHSLTLEAYIYSCGQIGGGEIVGRDAGNYSAYDLYLQNDYGPESFVFYVGNTSLTAPSPGLNQWVHVAATLNDTTGVMAIYVNGKLAASQVTSTRPDGTVDPYDNGVNIGYNNNNHGIWGFNGLIDEVRISDQALTPSQFLDAPASTPPTVTANPASQTVTAGSNVSFTAAATGDPTVQWQVSTDNGKTFTNINGATSTTLTLNAVTAAMNGNEYQAIFTNSAGTATSAAATLTVQVAPTILTNPANQTVTAGGNASFIATASGNPTPTVQWQVSTDLGKTFTNISGATSTTLTLNSVTPAMNGYEYRAVFTSSIGSNTSNAATLTVQYAPTVTTNPASQTVTAGGNVSFMANAKGNPNPTVQWQVSSDLGKTFSNLSGATSTTLTLSNVTAPMNGNEYQAVFANSAGSVTSAAATLTVQFTPTITTNPASQTVTAGGNVSFTAAANGNPTPSVQWQVSTDLGKTFTNVNGATSTTLALNNVSFALNGYEYRAVFTNTAGRTTTGDASLTVQTPPVVTLVPPPQSSPSKTPPVPPHEPSPPNVPPLLVFLDSLLGAVETTNSHGTTITGYFFGTPLLISTYDASGNFLDAILLGMDITGLVNLLK